MEPIKERLGYIDIAKAIGIFLVIAGHTFNNEYITAFIFSFHMPLFFVLSSYSARNPGSYREASQKNVKLIRRLPFVAIGLYITRHLFFLLKDGFSFDIKEVGCTILFASGADIPEKMIGGGITGIGMVWFLVVLLLCRIVWNYVSLQNRIIKYMLIFVLQVAGVAVGQSQWLPFDLDIVMVCLFFFLVGDEIKNMKNIKNNNMHEMIICAILYIGLVYFISKYSGIFLNIAYRRYPLYPLCMLCSILGVIVIIGFSRMIEPISFIKIPMSWLGKNSLILYSVHYMDLLFDFLWRWFSDPLISFLCRFLIDVGITFIVSMMIEKMKTHIA